MEPDIKENGHIPEVRKKAVSTEGVSLEMKGEGWVGINLVKGIVQLEKALQFRTTAISQW